MSYRIRKAVARDITAIRLYDIYIEPKALIDCIDRKQVYVLEIDGMVVGTMRFSLFWSTYPFLDHILLDVRYRGHGYGTKMMRFWEEEMRRQGYQYLLTSTQQDETAWKFYEKLGFVRTGGFYPPGQKALELIYQKSFKQP